MITYHSATVIPLSWRYRGHIAYDTLCMHPTLFALIVSHMKVAGTVRPQATHRHREWTLKFNVFPFTAYSAVPGPIYCVGSIQCISKLTLLRFRQVPLLEEC